MCSVVVDEEEILRMVGKMKVGAACWETPSILSLCNNRLFFLFFFFFYFTFYIYFSSIPIVVHYQISSN